ncbi:predicted protein [Histoplasma capsulatum G186AR]|uniref:Uncharacterized protein n=1 Tax=Ajellomyces capsulatus (strain G186AR / H82 / ATCC MYA-2454 / RMSCC 2432) TaxID=447093 RepID=C0ND82_AJECG|nr:uncharacterized protein HCBG_01078 [Histoplasma capsulatum G186AR]EEH11623.1 predicted protein [Histoplasma capsulatum G186AR]
MPKRRIGHTGDILSHPLVGLFKTVLPVVHRPFVEGGGAAMLTRPRQWNFLGVFLGPVVVVGSWPNGESLDPIQASVPQGPIIVDTILVPKKIKQHILQILLGQNSRDYF